MLRFVSNAQRDLGYPIVDRVTGMCQIVDVNRKKLTRCMDAGCTLLAIGTLIQNRTLGHPRLTFVVSDRRSEIRSII